MTPENLKPIIKKTVNTFNKFFCDIPKQIENKIVETHKNYQDYLINYIEHTSNLDPTRTGSAVLCKIP